MATEVDIQGDAGEDGGMDQGIYSPSRCGENHEVPDQGIYSVLNGYGALYKVKADMIRKE